MTRGGPGQHGSGARGSGQPGGAAGTGARDVETAVQPGRGAPDGRYQAVPVGTVIPAEWDGHQGEVHVQALVLAPGPRRHHHQLRQHLAATQPGLPSRRSRHAQPSFPPFGGSGVTDDQGRRYRLTLEVVEGGWHETRRARPRPRCRRPGTRWLDMPVSPGQSIRIDLTGAPASGSAASTALARPLGELLLGRWPRRC